MDFGKQRNDLIINLILPLTIAHYLPATILGRLIQQNRA